jgi:hypothetical protein
MCFRSRLSLQQPELVSTEALARLESLCTDVRILVPDNALLPPQATVYFVFYLFQSCSSGGGPTSVQPPFKAKTLEGLFSKFWSSNSRYTCAECITGPGGGQVEYLFSRPSEKPQKQPERLKKFFHLDLVKLLLHGREIRGAHGLEYDLRLRDEIYDYCFDGKPWDHAAWHREATRVWRLLCQRETAGRVAALATDLETLPGYLPATVRRVAEPFYGHCPRLDCG